MVFFFLQVLRLRGIIPRETKWDVVVDLFFYREPEEAEKEEQAAKEAVAVKPEVVQQHEPQDLEWSTLDTQDWATTEPAQPAAPVAGAPAPAAGAPFQAASTDDWAAQVQEEWGANTTPAQPAPPNWGTSTSDWQ